MSDDRSAFISYRAREDKDLVRWLADRLRADGWAVWVDVDDIPWSADWRREVESGIDAADAVIVLLSPDWLSSQACRAEFDHTVASGKRIVPVVAREVDPALVPAPVDTLNWVPFAVGAGRDTSYSALTQALETDLDWVRLHSRYLVRAREWEANGEERGRLARGASLREAEHLLLGADGKEPAATPLQIRYVSESRRAAVTGQRRLFAGVSTALVVALGLAVFALIQRGEAIEQSQLSRSRELAAQSLGASDSDAAESLRTAVDAMGESPTPQAVNALREAMTQPHVIGAIGDDEHPATAVARSGDGRWVVVTDRRGHSQLWDTRTLERHALPDHDEKVEFASFSADGKRVVTTSRDAESAVVSAVPSGRLLRNLNGNLRTAASIDEHGTRLAASDFGGTVQVFDVTTGRPVGPVMCCHQADGLELSPDGTHVASWSFDGTAHLWTVADGHDRLIEHRDSVIAARFSHDSSMFVTSGEGGEVRVFDVATGGERYAFPHDTDVNDVEFSGRDFILATGSSDGRAFLWDLESGQAIIELDHDAGVNTITPDDSTPFTVTRTFDNTITLWNAPAQRPIQQTSVPGRAIFPRYGAGGTLSFVEQQERGVVRMWGQRSWRLLAKLRGPAVADEDAFTRDGRVLAAGVGSDRSVEIRSLDDDALVGEPFVPECRDVRWDTLLLALSPDGRTLATNMYQTGAGGPCPTDVWDVKTGAKLATIDRAEPVGNLSFSPDSRRLAITGADQTASVWDARRGTRTARCPLDSRTYSVALDSTHLLAAGSDDGTVSLFDVRSCKKPRAVLRGHEGEVFATAFSRDGSLLVTGSADHTAIVWDVASRSKRAVLRGHSDEVVSARFSPDGEFVVTKGGDGTYRVWDATTGERIERGPLTYAASGLAAVTFERSSSRLLMTDQQFVYQIPCAACAPVDELLARAQARRRQLG